MFAVWREMLWQTWVRPLRVIEPKPDCNPIAIRSFFFMGLQSGLGFVMIRFKICKGRGCTLSEENIGADLGERVHMHSGLGFVIHRIGFGGKWQVLVVRGGLGVGCVCVRVRVCLCV